MNTACLKFTNCHDCPYCDHTGSYGPCKYICTHKAVKMDTNINIETGDVKRIRGSEKVDAKYDWLFPIIAERNEETGKQIDIPNWCPILEAK